MLHLLALANEAGVPLAIDDFNPISDRTPLIVDLKPGGKYVATDLHKAGGVPLVGKRLAEANLLHGGAMTVTGKTIGEEAAAAKETRGPAGREDGRGSDQEDRRPASILRGNLAPDGCVVKIAGYAAHNHTGPARVFDSEEATFAALQGRPDHGGRRRRHPLRGAERRSGDARDARRSPARSRARASANRSRCSPTAASRARPGA